MTLTKDVPQSSCRRVGSLCSLTVALQQTRTSYRLPSRKSSSSIHVSDRVHEAGVCGHLASKRLRKDRCERDNVSIFERGSWDANWTSVPSSGTTKITFSTLALASTQRSKKWIMVCIARIANIYCHGDCVFAPEENIWDWLWSFQRSRLMRLIARCFMLAEEMSRTYIYGEYGRFTLFIWIYQDHHYYCAIIS